MATFDSMMETAKTTAAAASKKAEELANVAKLKLDGAQLNQDIKKLFVQMGEFVYRSYRNAESGTEQIEQWCDQVDTKKEELRKNRAKINALLHKKVCPECSHANDEESIFCARCGAKLTEDEQQDDHDQEQEQK